MVGVAAYLMWERVFIGDPERIANSSLLALGVSIALALGARLVAGGDPPSIGYKPLARWEYVVGAVVFGAAAVARVLYLDSLPPGLNNDEARNGTLAIAVLEGTPFRPTLVNRDYLTHYTIAGLLKVFGVSVVTLRMTGVLSGMATVISVAGIGRRLFNPTVAWCAAIFAAFSPMEIEYSRTGHSPLFSNLYLLPGLYLLIAGWQSRRLSVLLVSGLLCGLSASTYFNSKFFAPVFAVFVTVAILARGRTVGWRWAVSAVSVWGIFLLIGSGPTWYHLVESGASSALHREAGLLQSAQGNDQEISVVSYLGERISVAYGYLMIRAASMIATYRGPVLLQPEAQLVIIGSVFMLFRKPRILAAMAGVWIFLGLLPGLVSWPSPRRLLLALPMFHLIAADALDWVVRRVSAVIGGGYAVIAFIGCGAVTAAFVWTSLNYQFLAEGWGHKYGLLHRAIAEYIEPRCDRKYFVIEARIGDTPSFEFLLYPSTGNTEFMRAGYGYVGPVRRPCFSQRILENDSALPSPWSEGTPGTPLLARGTYQQAASTRVGPEDWGAEVLAEVAPGTDEIVLLSIERRHKQEELLEIARSIDPEATVTEQKKEVRGMPPIVFFTAAIPLDRVIEKFGSSPPDVAVGR